MTYIPGKKLVSTKSSFGDDVAVGLTPEVQLSATYGSLDGVESLVAEAGGSVTAVSGMFKLSSSAAVGGYAVVRSKRAVQYRPGQGVLLRVGAIFDDDNAVANSLQQVGVGTANNGYFFGYNGTDFGIKHVRNGLYEIRHLKVTGGAGGSETATVTLDGTGLDVALTAGNAAHNASEIAKSIIAQSGTNWHAYATNDIVKCVFRGVGAKTGTYSFSSATATATINQIVQGAANQNIWVNQADWNMDTASWLVPGSGNVYTIAYQWLGFGNITFCIEDPETGEPTPVHMIKYANSNAYPSLSNPALRAEITSASLGSTTDMSMYGASLGIFTYGDERLLSSPRGLDNTRTAVTTGSGLVNILSLRNTISFNDVFNNGEIVPTFLTCSTDSTKGAAIELWKNPDIGGDEEDFTLVQSGFSMAEYDVQGQTVDTTGGTLIAVFALGPNGSETINLKELVPEILAGERLVIAGKLNSGASSDISVTINWREST